ncbi:hypothetical protein ACFFRR_003377 [Megaselia abdita]
MLLSSNTPKLMSGVMHCDELQYIFSSENYKEDVDVDFMPEMFVRFATTGDPNLPGTSNKWMPTNESSFVMANISICDESKEDCKNFFTTDPYLERYKVWDELFPM